MTTIGVINTKAQHQLKIFQLVLLFPLITSEVLKEKC